jgi:hypothetical protein
MHDWQGFAVATNADRLIAASQEASACVDGAADLDALF